MDSLRQKLENQGLRDVVYMVVNHQGAQAQSLHAMLAQRLSEHISLYKQDETQPNVWQTLGGNIDEFFIYDRFVVCTFLFCLRCHCFLYIDGASPSICKQVWPSHPPNFTAVLHYWTRTCGESGQRHLLQFSLWRVYP